MPITKRACTVGSKIRCTRAKVTDKMHEITSLLCFLVVQIPPHLSEDTNRRVHVGRPHLHDLPRLPIHVSVPRFHCPEKVNNLDVLAVPFERGSVTGK